MSRALATEPIASGRKARDMVGKWAARGSSSSQQGRKRGHVRAPSQGIWGMGQAPGGLRRAAAWPGSRSSTKPLGFCLLSANGNESIQHKVDLICLQSISLPSGLSVPHARNDNDFAADQLERLLASEWLFQLTRLVEIKSQGCQGFNLTGPAG